MANESVSIIQKSWHYSHFLRDDYVSYSDYVEQPMFLKMVDEKTTFLKLSKGFYRHD